MSRTERHVDCPPADVFEILAHGWLYANWVVGASRIRSVDADWPAPGSRIHHSVGSWPLLIDDTTVVLDCDPPRRLKMRARAWPAGEAEVTVTVAPDGTGSRVSISEDAVAGPGRLLPRPLRSLLLDLRNKETLLRLEMLAVGHAAREPDRPRP